MGARRRKSRLPTPRSLPERCRSPFQIGIPFDSIPDCGWILPRRGRKEQTVGISLFETGEFSITRTGSRFRSSHHIAAPSCASFGIKARAPARRPTTENEPRGRARRRQLGLRRFAHAHCGCVEGVGVTVVVVRLGTARGAAGLGGAEEAAAGGEAIGVAGPGLDPATLLPS
jgi:hypothetical protein